MVHCSMVSEKTFRGVGRFSRAFKRFGALRGDHRSVNPFLKHRSGREKDGWVAGWAGYQDALGKAFREIENPKEPDYLPPAHRRRRPAVALSSKVSKE
jgi:hypothetical protein